ncbi:vWA domain-containing protein [Cutibacterium avidum]|uniref:vWA domain-containing protein n=1 Tax=Cutibacterium avidum TaxID=33010 RepID=UPI00083E765F|nr:VWA domain-containing protein [Cutibacterium avidum]AOG28938.1 hypothetical protein BFS79_11010 [Cutibacterium avidum]MBX7475051.1 VWA domain-containing protein [Streptomyces sp. MAG02]
MDLMWWWMWPIVVVAVAMTVLIGLVLRRHESIERLAVAHVDRLRALPAYRDHARRRVRCLVVEVVCWAVAACGVGLVAARLQGIDDDDRQIRTRDVMLCLDVSGSMEGVDRQVINTYIQLADRITDDRIGFVMFDSSSVTVFPLTHDRDIVKTGLKQARDQLDRADLPSGVRYGPGGSLVGDGLASCLSRFDQLDQPRSRNVVLATDNMNAGPSVYTLPQAIDLAVRRQVMVFGIVPENTDLDARAAGDELHQQVLRTHGQTLTIPSDGQADTADIAHRIQSQAKKAVMAMATHRSYDRPWPGALMVGIGTLGALVARRREER